MRSAVLVRDDIDARTTPVRAIGATSDELIISGGGVTVRCRDVEVTSFPTPRRWDAGATATSFYVDVPDVAMSGMSHHLYVPGPIAAGNVINCNAINYVAHFKTINGCLSMWFGNEQGSSWVQCGYVGASVCTQGTGLRSSDLEELPALVFDSADLTATIDKMRSTLDSGKVDADDLAAASRAVEEAITFLRRNGLSGRPRVMMSDDGVLTLQWRNETMGAALIFTGDGTVSVALKNAQTSYPESLEGIALHAQAPAAFASIVEAIVG